MKVFFLLNLVLLCGVNYGFFGHHASRRIIDGLEAKPADYKFQVAIMSNHKLRCSGTIIAADVIITTATCLSMNMSTLTVLAGTHDLKGAGHIFEIQKIIKHPKWKNGNDLAIIQTKESMTELNETNIDGIELNFKPLPENGMVNISGWGAKSLISRSSQVLHYASVKLIHWNECIHKLPVQWKSFHGSFCTFGGKSLESMCWQDQGGPVVYNNTLIGVSTVSFMCTNPNIHLGIRAYAEWLNDVISKF